MNNSYSSSRVSPPKLLVSGFLVAIILGTGLLMLPQATVSGISPVDALFTATSAVCVTGLIVKNTPVDFTLFGQMVILALIQLGGLGYMSMATLIALIAGRKIGIAERILIKESLNIATLEGIVKFMKGMLLFVVIAEVAGTLLLYVKFSYGYGLDSPLFQAVFHSVSAFNNAGFSLFENNLVNFRGDIGINFIFILLIFFGGIGFTVIDDLYGRVTGQEKKVMLHTRIVLIASIALVVAGAALIFYSERTYLFQQNHAGVGERILESLFASVTARTAGFNTVDYSLLQPATLFLTIVLMFIGASPGSTGGGIKTTTFSVVILHLWSTIRGRGDTVAFTRRIPPDLVARSLVVMALAVMFVAAVTFVIVDIEHVQFLRTFFEVVSAFGTVGLSVGDGGARSFCATFSNFSKCIIVITMFAGRLGPLTLFMSLVEQEEQRVQYPEGRVMIG